VRSEPKTTGIVDLKCTRYATRMTMLERQTDQALSEPRHARWCGGISFEIWRSMVGSV